MRGLGIGALALALVASGCGKGATSLADARDGLPQIADLAVPLPGDTTVPSNGSTSQPLTSTSTQKTAPMYTVTRAITALVNGGVVWSLGTIRLISLLPPTSQRGDTFTWGPSQPTGLEPKNNFKLVVTKNADGSYTYSLDGKKASDPDSAYQALASGTHTPGVPGKSGKGTLKLDFDAAQELNAPGKATGVANVTYGYQVGVGYQVAVDFTHVKDANSGERVDAKYRFQQSTSGVGSFEFTTEMDLRNDGNLENVLVRSRWEITGAGRSDAQASGGSLQTAATLSECWDDNFDLVYGIYSFDQTKNQGDESSCAFTPADYSTLQ